MTFLDPTGSQELALFHFLIGNVHHYCHTIVIDNLKLIVHHNYDHNCDGHSYLKGMSVIQLSFLIEILKEIYE